LAKAVEITPLDRAFDAWDTFSELGERATRDDLLVVVRAVRELDEPDRSNHASGVLDAAGRRGWLDAETPFAILDE